MLDVVSACGLQHIEGAGYIGLHIGIGAVVTEGNGYERRKVQHMATVSHSRINSSCITDVARYHFDVTQYRLFDAV